MVTHVGFWTGFYGHGLLGAMTQRLEAGVAVFFVLSGFLLSYPWLRQLRTGARRDTIGRYAFKRVLRILPVYWVAVIAAVVLVPRNDGTSLPRTLDALLMIDMYKEGLLLEGLTQMWSLATEVAFYVALPALMALLVGLVARSRWRPRPHAHRPRWRRSRVAGLGRGCGRFTRLVVGWLGQPGAAGLPGLVRHRRRFRRHRRRPSPRCPGS